MQDHHVGNSCDAPFCSCFFFSRVKDCSWGMSGPTCYKLKSFILKLISSKFLSWSNKLVNCWNSVCRDTNWVMCSVSHAWCLLFWLLMFSSTLSCLLRVRFGYPPCSARHLWKMCILNFLKSDLELSHDIYFPSKNAFLLIISPFSVGGAFFPSIHLEPTLNKNTANRA